MMRTAPFGGRNIDNLVRSFPDKNDFRETTLLSVIIGKEFKTVVFVKLFRTECYVVIGNTTAYDAACYWNTGSKKGIALIQGIGTWYRCTPTEGNLAYQQIVHTKRTSTQGRPYYRWETFDKFIKEE